MGGTTAAWQAGAGTPTGVSGGQCVLGCVLVGGAMRSAYDTRIAYCALRSAYCVLGNYDLRFTHFTRPYRCRHHTIQL